MANESKLIFELAHRNEPFDHELTESAHIDYLKTQLVDGLRSFFSRHSVYTYVPDEHNFGPDLDRTQIVITDIYNYGVKFLPAITIRFGGSSTYHVSFNQNEGTVVYKYNDDGTLARDSRGRLVPLAYETAGAWNSQISLTISAEDTTTREELGSILSVDLIHLQRFFFYTKGIFIDKVSPGGESETPYANDHIYQLPISMEVYSEWVRRIPVGNAPFDKIKITSIHQGGWIDEMFVPGVEYNSTLEVLLEWNGTEYIPTTSVISKLTEITTFHYIDSQLSGSEILEELVEEATIYRERLKVIHQVFGAPLSSTPEKLLDGTILDGDGATFKNGLRVNNDNTVILNSGVVVTSDDEILNNKGTVVIADMLKSPLTGTSIQTLTALDVLITLVNVPLENSLGLKGAEQLIEEALAVTTENNKVENLKNLQKDLVRITKKLKAVSGISRITDTQLQMLSF